MPWKLIRLIVILAVFLLLVAFNLGKKCDISFGFVTLHDVPVFMTAFTSFLLGMLCALPYIIALKMKGKTRHGESGTDHDTDRKAWKPRGKKTASPETPEDSSFSDGGPYGVN